MDGYMRTRERTIFMGIGTIFLLALIVLVGLIMKTTGQKIVASFPTPTGYEFQFFEMRLLAPDLPSGYVRSPGTVRLLVNNGVGEKHIYEAKNSSSAIQLVEQIVIFDEVTHANSQLEKEIAEWSSLHFLVDGEVLTKMPNADNVAWACDDPVTISGRETLRTRYCITLATYKNIYIVLRGSVVEGKLLTMDKYLELLGLLDERITKVQVNAAQVTATP